MNQKGGTSYKRHEWTAVIAVTNYEDTDIQTSVVSEGPDGVIHETNTLVLHIQYCVKIWGKWKKKCFKAKVI